MYTLARRFVRWLDRVLDTGLIPSGDIFINAARTMQIRTLLDHIPSGNDVHLISGDTFEINLHTLTPSGIIVNEPAQVTIDVSYEMRKGN